MTDEAIQNGSPESSEEDQQFEADATYGLPASDVVEKPGLLTRGIKGMVALGVDALTLPVRVLRPIIMSETLAPARSAGGVALLLTLPRKPQG